MIIGPAFNGAWLGAVAGVGLWLTVTRQKIGPLYGALGAAITLSILSAVVTFLVGGLTSPPGADVGGAGIGPSAGHFIGVFFVYLFGVLPVPIVVGAAFGWFRHRC
ncbi:hypothetical protein [Stieleria tagensis]|uniref:hypothetical protein n=1 Tax=Stieleria tagensis TaxID=2956795 RepID=UPI00209A7BB8|nr:hypothetical protein [Stieleria tagensis]